MRRSRQRRRRPHERLGIRHARPVQEFLRAAALDDLARIHHRDLVGMAGDDAEIVGDENDRHVPLALQLPQKIQYLALNRDVQRGGGLVGDQELGLPASAMAMATRWRIPPERCMG